MQHIDETNIPEDQGHIEEELQPEVETADAPVEEENPTEPEGDPAEAELAKQKELYLRLAAEYDNFRKRTQREKEALSADIKADCVAALLPVVDNLERALAATDVPADDPMRTGIEMTLTNTLAIFEKLGVTPYGEVGQPFDPNRHNCVSTAASEEFASGQIILVMQKGYILGDKVVREALVQVAE